MRKLIYALAVAALLAAGFGSSLSARNDSRSATVRNMAIFNGVLKELSTSYVDTIDMDALVRSAIDAMLAGIDPYTEYYSAAEVEDLTSISSGQYGGIGAVISQRDGRVYVSQPLWDAPARRSGLRHGDIILAIDGDEIAPGTGTDVVSRRLRGQAGSSLRVRVKRPFATGADSILDVNIVRETINNNPLPYWGVDSTGVGYLRLTTFNEQSAPAVREAVTAMKHNPALRGLVIDLRDNGGGLLESAVNIVGLFVPKGTEVVRTRGGDSYGEKIYKTTRTPLDTELPLVVLVNENTASSSEIVAGALQDLDRAVVLGDRSYGKGLVQTSRPLPYDGFLKVTVARYYIPSGRLIQAVDYSHRNPDGSVARIPDSLTRVWHTAAGREVRDGGGITPDVSVVDTTMNRLIYNVIADLWAYDFANRYRMMHDSVPAATEWIIGDSIFNQFKGFIDPARFKYDRMCEVGIKYLRDAAEFEGYMTDSVRAQIDLLADMLRHNLDHDLDFNRPDLIEILDSELSERYYDDSDRVLRSLRYDATVDSARAVLLSPARYKSILSPAR